MGKYTDAALAAYQGREAAEEQARQAERDALVAAAKAAAAPLWAGADGKPIIDAAKQTRAEHVDMEAGLVVLSVLNDKLVPEVYFAVRPNSDAKAQVVEPADGGGWTGYGGSGLRGPEVSTMAEVGAVLAGDV